MDILVKEKYIKQAAELHRNHPVVDAHLDLAGEILIRKQLGEKNIIREHYLGNWRKAGLNLVVSSVYVPTKILKQGGTEAAWDNAVRQIGALKAEIQETEEVMFVGNKKELAKAAQGEKTGILIYMEGLDCIGENLERLEILYEMGVRGASLTWSRKNDLASGCCKAGEKFQITGGLTKKGKEAVKELERLSMFLDVSHLNDDGFEDLKSAAKKPFCATHSCARAVYENYRNLTEEQMEYLAAQGGVMGLNGCKYIAGSLSGNHLEMLCRHGEYEIEKAGKNHVGFGFDLCDSYDEADRALEDKTRRNQTPAGAESPEAGLSGKMSKKQPEKCDCLLHHGQIPLLSAAFLQRGMAEETAAGMIGGNFLNYFNIVLP